MEIFKGSITHLVGRGYHTLQVSDLAIVFDGVKMETEEIPDDWIIKLHSGSHRLATKNDGYFLYLSKKGFEANKDKLKVALESAQHKRGTWEEFLEYVKNHFKAVDQANKKYKQSLLQKIKEFNEVLKIYESQNRIKI
jgi:hypothetical protein